MNRRMRHASHRRPIDEPMVNLTPLIDVVFVILIMFILVAPMLELDRVELADASSNQQDGSKTVHESSPIAIHVLKDNTIHFNNRTVTLLQLPELINQARKRHPTTKPQIFHDRRAHFGVYQSIKNILEEAGFEQMDIVLRPS